MAADVLDCLVIGAGPAGLTAAVYLARYRRRFLVIDAGKSRLRWIPRSRNVPAYPDGIPGPQLLQRLREHADRYHSPIEEGTVDSLAVHDGVFEALVSERSVRALRVLLASGARDVVPELPGVKEGLRTGNVRYCPICDGFETQQQRVAVLGRDSHGLHEPLSVAGFDNQVTWLAMGSQE
ncbi:MAG: hypothetical protein NVS2B4_21480 [Ramlibacter sp.]